MDTEPTPFPGPGHHTGPQQPTAPWTSAAPPPAPGPPAPTGPSYGGGGDGRGPSRPTVFLREFLAAPRPLGRPPAWVAPALLAAVLVGGLLAGGRRGGYYGGYYGGGSTDPVILILLTVAVAATVLAFDRRPAQGLGALIVLTGLSLALGYGYLVTAFLALLVLLFGCAAYGRRPTCALTGLALLVWPLAVIPIRLLAGYGTGSLSESLSQRSASDALSLAWQQFQDATPALVGLGGPPVLAWLGGLAMRSMIRSRTERAAAEAERDRATREAAYAQEVARLRAGQAQLARDVHDVVGHSLAVILAQAQSAQFLGDDEVAKMRETLGHVADSARRSLGDVRGVLAGTRDPRTATPTAGLDSLIAGVRAAGNEVIERIEGQDRPLPPEIDQVAYRVLQEMLTNALKHGRPGGPVWVRRIWPPQSAHALVIEVHNLLAAEGSAGARGPDGTGGSGMGGGIGLESMRHRLESVGGGLHLGSERTSDGTMFAATATLPLRATELGGATEAAGASHTGPNPFTERQGDPGR